MSIYNEPGRGRKQCPTCQKYVGVMSKTCEGCGHTFNRAVDAKPVQPKPVVVKVAEPAKPAPVAVKVPTVDSTASDEAPTGLADSGHVIAPSGPCPVKLDSPAAESVHKWACDVRVHFHGKGKRLDPAAMRYLLATQFGPHTHEYATALEALES